MNIRQVYKFFDDSYELGRNGYHGEDFMSPKQFIVMGSIFIIIIIISVLLRRVKREKLFTIYKILAIFLPIFEIVKISYSTYFDIINGETFNYGGIIPLYTCSMVFYFLPFVAWGKGKMQRYSMAFFTTIGLVAGLSNFIYLSSARFYPIFSYGGMYAVILHALIVFIGMSLMITELYTPSFKSIYEGMIPILLFSIIVIPVNFIIRKYTSDTWVDYMLLMRCESLFFFGDLSNFLAGHHLLLLFPIFMLSVVYPLATTLITSIDMGVIRVVNKVSEKVKLKKGLVEAK